MLFFPHRRKQRRNHQKRALLCSCILALCGFIAARYNFARPPLQATTQLAAADVHKAAVSPSQLPPPSHSPLQAPPAVAPRIAATAWILIDAHSNAVLAQHNAHQPLPPASTTKVMTLYVLNKKMQQDNIPASYKTRVSKQAVQSVGKGGSRMWLKEGQIVSLHDLQLGIAVHSGNDATVAAAQAVAQTESNFVQLMNQTAQQLGMQHTHFANSSGLPAPTHRSTAYDLALLTQAFIKHFPQQYKIFKTKCFTYQGHTDCVKNFLLWQDPSVDGVKTGHTQEAGYCLIASAQRNQSPESNPMRLICVVLGTKSEQARVQESQKLLNYGFRHYNTQTVAYANQPLAKPRCWLGHTSHLAAGVAAPITLTVPRPTQNRLQTNMQWHEPLTAPIQKGDTLGTFTVTLDGQLQAQQPLVALQSITKAGLLTQFKDHIHLFLQKLSF